MHRLILMVHIQSSDLNYAEFGIIQTEDAITDGLAGLAGCRQTAG